jgi:hypothetical protein
MNEPFAVTILRIVLALVVGAYSLLIATLFHALHGEMYTVCAASAFAVIPRRSQP